MHQLICLGADRLTLLLNECPESRSEIFLKKPLLSCAGINHQEPCACHMHIHEELPLLRADPEAEDRMGSTGESTAGVRSARGQHGVLCLWLLIDVSQTDQEAHVYDGE